MKPRIFQRVLCAAIVVLLACSHFGVCAQNNSPVPLKIAVLAPLYLDSAFDGMNYKLGNTSIPRYFLNGLEFYNGVMMAIDSLQKEGVNAELWIYDTKAKGKTSESIAAEMGTMRFNLVIASFTSAQEQRVFSEFSFSNSIPLVSATYPNDAYVSGNPYFIMINSSLKTHIEAIYRYTQRNYPIGKYIFITRKGPLEDKIMQLFSDEGKKMSALNYKTLQLGDNFTAADIVAQLDSNRQNVVICGSLDEAFGTNLVKALDQTTSYQLVLIGMPTWDALRAVYKTENDKLEVVYSTPYRYDKSNKTVDAISQSYKLKFNGRPGYMFFKGFETMFNFTHLMNKYNPGMMQHLSDNSFEIANNFQFQPVKLDDKAATPDYIENKKLYFIHIFQGTIRAVY
ncbi:MAG TPA: hypothetical protein PKM63_13130 [Panacibacter sp.]|nr:hypothetical protein [Panacibacter sp.]HNP45225.1 hypothetical protein [Panacibacter sp.]